MECIGPFCDVLKCLREPTCRYIEHHRNLNERRNDLRRKAAKLNARKKDTESRKETEIHQGGKILKEEVKRWLEEVDDINDEIQYINRRVQTVSFFSRARLGKRVAQTVRQVEELIQQGTFTGPLVIDDPSAFGDQNDPSPRVAFDLKNLEGETRARAEIWEFLIGDNSGKIGVCGMGGIGKTTIMRHIFQQLSEETQFDRVIWVNVPKPLPFDIIKLQQAIAQAMNIMEPEPTLVAAVEDRLGQERFVLILDDVWEMFSDFEIGITSRTLSNGSKLVLTSRLTDVCTRMGCKIVDVGRLSDEDSKKLFLKHANIEVPKASPLENILGDIVKECDGLPLAIVVIAESLRNVDYGAKWKDTLTYLREHGSSLEGTEKLHQRLKLSYDRLNPDIKICFLYCSLFPEAYEIERNELIEYWIDEGFLEFRSREDNYNRGRCILDILVNKCLLEKGGNEDSVKMHDVMRDTAIYITRSSPHFMVKAGREFRELGSIGEWKEDLEKVSLMMTKISEIPPRFSPNCEFLSTLFLQKNLSLTGMPKSFFWHMRRLRILDLSDTSIKRLPSSVSNLEKLNALVLRNCKNLRYLPSLEKLKKLRKLDLRRAGIEKVPHGLEMLVNLTYLDLFTKSLQKLPNGILSKLSCLQYLVLHIKSNGIKINGRDAARLKDLETFEGRFHKLVDFNMYCESVEGRSLTSYLLVMASPGDKFDTSGLPGNFRRMVLKVQEPPSNRVIKKLLMKAAAVKGVVSVSFDVKGLLTVDGDMDPIKVVVKLRKLWKTVLVSVQQRFSESPLPPRKNVILSGGQIRREDPVVLPTDLRCLLIFECHNVRSLSDISLFFQETNELSCCSIHDCREMESVLDLSSSSSQGSPLQNLENLWLDGLDNLHTLVKVVEASAVSISSSGNFSQLKSFWIEGCSNMKQLFPLELVHDLQNLKKLVVRNCRQMKEIIASKEEEENHKGKGIYSPTTFTFPKLRELELKDLPELKSICSSNGVIICDSLKVIEVCSCPNLKRMPLNLPLFQDAGQSTSCPLKRIYIDSREWWESVEWDYPSAKNILEPFLQI